MSKTYRLLEFPLETAYFDVNGHIAGHYAVLYEGRSWEQLCYRLVRHATSLACDPFDVVKVVQEGRPPRTTLLYPANFHMFDSTNRDAANAAKEQWLASLRDRLHANTEKRNAVVGHLRPNIIDIERFLRERTRIDGIQHGDDSRDHNP